MAGQWDWVADGVAVTTSRRDATTTTLVLGPAGALLVDPAWDPDELAWIADDLDARRIPVTAGFATHAHRDHLLWHPRLGNPPRLASVPTAALAQARRDELVAELGPGWPADLAGLVGRVDGVPGGVLPWDGQRVELLVHDGHCGGHTALWIPHNRVLVAGDMLSDLELPLLETSSLHDYLAGLQLLRPHAERARTLVPGHGSVATDPATARHRWRVDADYVAALRSGAEPRDPRLANPGMAQAHAANLAAVSAVR
jgi:hydroxyacylglutathione hydrolase